MGTYDKKAMNAEKLFLRYADNLKIHPKTGNYIYPAHVGGLYLRDGEMVVLTTRKESAEREQRSLAFDLDATNIRFAPAQYTYDDLNGVMDQINEWICDNPEHPVKKNVVFYCVKDAENTILVELKDCSEDAVAAFRSAVADAPMLRFQQAKERCTPTAYHNAGELLSNMQGTATSGTLGFRVMYQGKECFVTAGHVALLYPELYSSLSAKAGTVIQNTIQYGGNIDLAIYEKDANATLTNDIYDYNKPLSTSIHAPAVGTELMKSGGVLGISMGRGTVESTNATAPYDASQGLPATNVFNLLFVKTMFTEGGDSGGPVWLPTNMATVGIVSGKKGAEGTYVSKVTTMVAKGVQRY